MLAQLSLPGSRTELGHRMGIPAGTQSWSCGCHIPRFPPLPKVFKPGLSHVILAKSGFNPAREQDKTGAQNGALGELQPIQAGDGIWDLLELLLCPLHQNPLKVPGVKWDKIPQQPHCGCSSWTGDHKVPLPIKPIPKELPGNCCFQVFGPKTNP